MSGEMRLRPVKITPDFTGAAAGSVLIECGGTRVLCTASVEENVPPFLRGKGKGWLTAEYAMLPGATPVRKARDFLKRDGRSVEISRLIGRCLRACVDLTRLGERTITIDCDVIEADGGTRTASVTGGFVALCCAVAKLLDEKRLWDSPVTRPLAAVSVGIVADAPTLDLCYAQDSRAQADMNVCMSRGADGALEYVEIQGTGEGRAYTKSELDALLKLAETGIEKLMAAQTEALGERARVIGKKPTLVLASGNKGKLVEMRTLLGDRFDVKSMKELGIDIDVEETGTTFSENARIKAEAILKITGCACVADDSGLTVDALEGRPGVYSARYAGVHGDDAANNQLLLRELEGKANRAARYECAMALARPGQETLIACGHCEGEILTEYRGTGGFGYDPLFFSYDLGETFAQSDLEKKNRVSHRARAIENLLTLLDAEHA